MRKEQVVEGQGEGDEEEQDGTGKKEICLEDIEDLGDLHHFSDWLDTQQDDGSGQVADFSRTHLAALVDAAGENESSLTSAALEEEQGLARSSAKNEEAARSREGDKKFVEEAEVMLDYGIYDETNAELQQESPPCLYAEEVDQLLHGQGQDELGEEGEMVESVERRGQDGQEEQQHEFRDADELNMSELLETVMAIEELTREAEGVRSMVVHPHSKQLLLSLCFAIRLMADGERKSRQGEAMDPEEIEPLKAKTRENEGGEMEKWARSMRRSCCQFALDALCNISMTRLGRGWLVGNMQDPSDLLLDLCRRSSSPLLQCPPSSLLHQLTASSSSIFLLSDELKGWEVTDVSSSAVLALSNLLCSRKVFLVSMQLQGVNSMAMLASLSFLLSKFPSHAAVSAATAVGNIARREEGRKTILGSDHRCRILSTLAEMVREEE
eukprot:767244-Hanusia_phi.AAC.1